MTEQKTHTIKLDDGAGGIVEITVTEQELVDAMNVTLRKAAEQLRSAVQEDAKEFRSIEWQPGLRELLRSKQEPPKKVDWKREGF